MADTDQIVEAKINTDNIGDSDEVTGFTTDEMKENLNCRFYRNEWPELEDLVVVEIRDVNEDGAYVKLLEYNDREGLILASNTTRKRVKNVKKLLRLGTQDYMQIISIDKEGGFIDLSKRTVQPTDIETKKILFDKSKMVHLILRLTAFNLQCKLLDLYEQFAWDLYDKFEHAYDAMRLCLTDPDIVFSKITIKPNQKEALLANINKKMAAPPVKMRARINLTCYNFQGIVAIKESLLAAKKEVNDDTWKLIFQLIAAPEYKVEVVSLDKKGATDKIEQALEIIQREIKARGGLYKLIQGPTPIGTRNNNIDSEDIINQMALKEEEMSSGSEDNEEGMGNIEDEEFQVDEDEEEEKVESK